eukprot:TRINITY_DN15957_c0_g1_i15.p1 TRINITY_DN15957_c0_g1~~TRINITY_DN15957_c0_g1_i15.p1  ORF type:complete len:274 (+),score=47.90 TRINITY_DN15957_c0_g1_i15:76-822(+)
MAGSSSDFAFAPQPRNLDLSVQLNDLLSFVEESLAAGQTERVLDLAKALKVEASCVVVGLSPETWKKLKRRVTRKHEQAPDVQRKSPIESIECDSMSSFLSPRRPCIVEDDDRIEARKRQSLLLGLTDKNEPGEHGMLQNHQVSAMTQIAKTPEAIVALPPTKARYESRPRSRVRCSQLPDLTSPSKAKSSDDVWSAGTMDFFDKAFSHLTDFERPEHISGGAVSASPKRRAHSTASSSRAQCSRSAR